MKIIKYLNTNEEEVCSRQLNIFIGISIGNKFFNKENISGYLSWAIKNTKERVAILIPDKIHAINYEVKKSITKDHAIKMAYKEGKKIRFMLEHILEHFDFEKRQIVDILDWKDIETNQHLHIANILWKEFKNNAEFKKTIIKIVKQNVISDQLTDSDYEKLAAYTLEELPILINGIEHNNIKYHTIPYPGLSKIDFLAVELQEGKKFPNITSKLNIDQKTRLIEAYIE